MSRLTTIAHPPGIADGNNGWTKIREANARFWPRFSAAEYARRYHGIRHLMQARDIDCLIMFSSGYLDAANLIYVAQLYRRSPWTGGLSTQ